MLAAFIHKPFSGFCFVLFCRDEELFPEGKEEESSVALRGEVLSLAPERKASACAADSRARTGVEHIVQTRQGRNFFPVGSVSWT